jgi:hypothetical protein
MYQIELTCDGISPPAGETAAHDIEQEFRVHRQWHQDVSCRFENGILVLIARNDFDETGMALLDEFGDCLSAYLTEHGEVRVQRVDAA